MDMGMKVEIYCSGITFQGKVVLRNVTEIHYHYNRAYSKTPRIAFESDVHSTGQIFEIEVVKEFEALPESVIADNFSE